MDALRIVLNEKTNHKITSLIVINHNDCGAAKIVNGKKIFNLSVENKIHKESFINIKKEIAVAINVQ